MTMRVNPPPIVIVHNGEHAPWWAVQVTVLYKLRPDADGLTAAGTDRMDTVRATTAELLARGVEMAVAGEGADAGQFVVGSEHGPVSAEVAAWANRERNDLT